MLKPYKRSISPDARRFDSNIDVAKAVTADRGGIGIASFCRIGTGEGCGDQGFLRPRSPAIRILGETNEYPLSRNLYLYTTETADPQVANLIRFAVSPEAQTTLNEVGFIDQRVVALSYDKHSDPEAGRGPLGTTKARHASLEQRISKRRGKAVEIA